MNSKLAAVIGAVALFAVIVIVVLVTQGGSPDNTDLSKEPVIEAQTGDPPTTLEKTDLVVGDGEEAKSGDLLSVQYVGALYDTGEIFDSSWDDGEPLEFPLGAGQVIPGWDQGLEGMKVGGRRELVIPSDLAYGEAGSPPSIGPNATLTFIVDLEKVQPGGGTAAEAAAAGQPLPGSTQGTVPGG